MINSENTTDRVQPSDEARRKNHEEVKKPVESELLTKSLSGARAHAREPIGPEDLEMIRSAYAGTIGQPMTALIAGEIEGALEDGMAVPVVIEAITVTGWAPRPSPWYLRAVLQRWRRDGLLTMDALRADQAAHERATAGSWWQSNPALQYEQRPFEGDGSGLFIDMATYKKA